MSTKYDPDNPKRAAKLAKQAKTAAKRGQDALAVVKRLAAAEFETLPDNLQKLIVDRLPKNPARRLTAIQQAKLSGLASQDPLMVAAVDRVAAQASAAPPPPTPRRDFLATLVASGQKAATAQFKQVFERDLAAENDAIAAYQAVTAQTKSPATATSATPASPPSTPSSTPYTDRYKALQASGQRAAAAQFGDRFRGNITEERVATGFAGDVK